MVSKFTLVPSSIFSEDKAREILSEVVLLDREEPLSFLEVPPQSAVLVYAGDERPAVYDMLLSLWKIREYNKIAADYRDGCLSLVLSQGEQLQLCNQYDAPDFTTALYYLALAVSRLQINPQQSTVYFMTAPDSENVRLLYNYFKGVEVLR